MDLELRDRVAVITGGASGIGAACARALSLEGAQVAVLDRDSTKGEEQVSLILGRGGAACFVPTDVTDEASVAHSVNRTLATLGRPDILISCAGISGPVGVPLTHTSLDAWDRLMSVNVTGTFLIVKHCLPLLESGPVGTIVLLGSDSSLAASRGMASYCASKAAVLMLARALAVDHPGVRVNCLCPSVVDTPMSRKDLGLMSKGFAGASFPVMTADQIARHAVFLASPASAPMNGAALVVDFGFGARSAFPEIDFVVS